MFFILLLIHKHSQRRPVIIIHAPRFYGNLFVRVNRQCRQRGSQFSGSGGGTRIFFISHCPDADRRSLPFSFRFHAQGLHIHAVGQCQLVAEARAGGQGDEG